MDNYCYYNNITKKVKIIQNLYLIKYNDEIIKKYNIGRWIIDYLKNEFKYKTNLESQLKLIKDYNYLKYTVIANKFEFFYNDYYSPKFFINSKRFAIYYKHIEILNYIDIFNINNDYIFIKFEYRTNCKGQPKKTYYLNIPKLIEYIDNNNNYNDVKQTIINILKNI